MIQHGSKLAHYEVVSAIGRGGMGEVWRARDAKLGREVAIKTLPDEFAADPDRLARFEREARLLVSLNHPNIAAIHGLEEYEGTQFLVLELVEGPTLFDCIHQGAVPVEESLRLATEIAEALEAAHGKGVIHTALLMWLDTRYEEALGIVEQGLEHDPNDPWLKVNRCWVYGFSRDFTRWVDAARDLTTQEPFFGFGHYCLGCALLHVERHPEAIESFKRGIELDGRGSHHVGLLGSAYAIDGQEARAQECLEELETLERNGRDVAVWKLHVHCGRGDADAVIRCLERAIDARSSATIFVLVHPLTDFVAGDPRFHTLLQKAGLGYLIGRPRQPRWLPPRLRPPVAGPPSPL